ncbi:MAG: hypothetical protein ACE15C_03690 [Phycisphaerae bacterium]
MDAYLQGGMSVARLAGLCRMKPWAMGRRIRALLRRMTGKPFIRAIRAMPYMSTRHALLARRYYCHGDPISKLCRRRGLTRHSVRMRLIELSARIEQILRLRSEQSGRGPRTGQAGRGPFDGRAAGQFAKRGLASPVPRTARSDAAVFLQRACPIPARDI